MLPLTDTLLAGVAELMTRYITAPAGTRIAVAVSGGADSVVLLHVLHRLALRFQIALEAVHINHHLRGSESDEDQRFVQELAASLGLRLHLEQAPVAQDAGNLEQLARDARRKVFHSIIESGQATYVATGHTRSDQAETVLFRLLRGTGITGLAGMRVVTSDGILRPLLRTGRDQLRAWAVEQGLCWREDSSNSDLRFSRNLLRNEVLPLVQSRINPGVEVVLAQVANLAQAEEDYWQPLIDQHFQRFAKLSHFGLICDVYYLREQPLAIRRRVLRRAFLEVKGNLRSIDSGHVEAVVRICESDQGHDRVIAPGVDALRSFGTLRLAKPVSAEGQKRHYKLPLELGKEIALPFHAGCIQLELLDGDLSSGPVNCVNFKDGQDLLETAVEVARLNLDALGGVPSIRRLVIRNWEPGDGIQRAGHQNREKLKTLFQEEKVLLWKRRHWPVLELDGEIVWTRQFGAAAHAAAEPGALPAVSIRYSVCRESEVQFLTSY